MEDYLISNIEGSNGSLSDSNADNRTLLLSVSGTIDLSNLDVKLNPFIVLQSTQYTNLSNNSPFNIRLLAENGEILSVYPFAPKLDTIPVDSRNKPALISEAVPYINGTKKIVLSKDGLELASRFVSAHAPEVNILSPSGGEFFNSSITILWNAKDLDGDTLTYFLFYSNDGGRTWQSIGSNIQNTTKLQVDLETLPGSTVYSSLFRIFASDGINTALDDSNPFIIPKRIHDH